MKKSGITSHDFARACQKFVASLATIAVFASSGIMPPPQVRAADAPPNLIAKPYMYSIIDIFGAVFPDDVWFFSTDPDDLPVGKTFDTWLGEQVLALQNKWTVVSSRTVENTDGTTILDGSTGNIVISTDANVTGDLDVDTNLNVDGSTTLNGNITIDTEDSTDQTPRILDVTDLSNDGADYETFRLQLGDAGSGAQMRSEGTLDIFSKSALRLIGGRGAAVTTAPDYDDTTDTGIQIINTVDDSTALAILGGTGQTADLQQWQASDGTVLSVVDKDGYFGVNIADPAAKLDVGGEIKILPLASPPYACEVATKGTIYYDSGSDELLVCDGDDWITAATASTESPGSDMQLLFNNNTVIAGAQLYYNGGALGVGTSTISGTLKIDANGQIGATEFCDADGIECHSISDLAAGASQWDDVTGGIDYAGGNVGIGNTAPTAWLQIQGGTATNPPLKLTSGTNLTTPEAGSLEYDGSELYFSPSTTRETIAFLSDLAALDINDADADPTNEIQDLDEVLAQGNNTGGTTITGLPTPTDAADAATKGYIDINFLNLGGGTMTGSINMNGNAITGLPTPTADPDAASKWYVDNVGTAATQDLASVLNEGTDGGAKQIKNILDPTDPQDAATKAFVESQVGSINTNDADSDPTNEIQDLTLSSNTLSLTDSAVDIDLSGYLDNTDSQNLDSVLGFGNDAGGRKIGNLADPTLAQDAATRNYVDGNFVELGGDTMTGDLILPGIPGNDAGAVPKSYVDNFINGLSWKDPVEIGAGLSGTAGPIDAYGACDGVNALSSWATYNKNDNVIYVCNGSAWVQISSTAGLPQLAGDVTGDITSNTIAANAVTSGKILDGTIATDDLADGSVTSAKIGDGEIVNADVSATAAIDGTKISPNFGAQNVVTTGKIGAGTATPIGTLEVLSLRSPNTALIVSGNNNAEGTRLYTTDTTSILEAYQAEATGNFGNFLMRMGSLPGHTPKFQISNYSSGSDVILMTVDSTGKVGIGTQTPNAKLHVKTNPGTNAEIDIQSGAAPYWGIYQDETSQDLNFWNTANVLKLTNEGNAVIYGNLDMDSGTIGNLATPSSDADAATKEYVDDAEERATQNIEQVLNQGDNTNGKEIFGLPLVPSNDDTVAVSKKYVDTKAGAAELQDDDYGDITVSNDGADWTINNGAVTYAKLQNLSGNNLILGRSTAGAGSAEELSAATVRGILNVEDGADVTDSTNVEAAGAVMESDTSTALMQFVIDEDNFASDLATKVPTQQSVKAYVGSQVTAAIEGLSWKDPVDDADGPTGGLGSHGACDASKEGWATYNDAESLVYVCSDTDGLGTFAWTNIGSTAVIPTMAGEVTGDMTNNVIASGVVDSDNIANGTIVNEDVSDTAAIAGTKISPNFGSQNVVTTGNMGVGTTTPAEKLHVYDSTYNSGLIVGDNPNSPGVDNQKGMRIQPHGSGNVYVDYKTISGGTVNFRVGEGTGNGADRYFMTVDPTNAYVGIGTNTPSERLELVGNLKMRGDIKTDRWLNLDSNTGVGVGVFGNGQLNNTVSGDGVSNTAFGNHALRNTSTGNDNTGIGSHALYANNAGSNNSSLGAFALFDNTTGSGNNAIGAYSMYNNEIGIDNNALGQYALYSNTSGSRNGAIGTRALFNNTTGINNVALGAEALFNNQTGSANIALGLQSMYRNTFGSDNIMFGVQTGFYNYGGHQNTAIGNYAFGTPISDDAKAKTFTAADTDPATDYITIPSHGFGSANQKVLGKFTTTGTLPTGIILNTATYITVIDSNTIHKSDFTDGGTGTHTFTPYKIFTNSTALGYNAEPDASHQIVLGDTRITEVKTAGKIRSASTIAGDSGTTVTTKDYVDAQASSAATWGNISGTLGDQSDLQNALDAKVNLAGGTMTGDLILNADPSVALGAATKQYVDNLDTDDADADPTNEFQDLTLNGNTLSLTDSTVDIDLSGYLDNTDDQTLSEILGVSTDAGGNKITNLGAPTADSDASTKKYVDDEVTAAIEGLSWKDPVDDADGPTGGLGSHGACDASKEGWATYNDAESLVYVCSDTDGLGTFAWTNIGSTAVIPTMAGEVTGDMTNNVIASGVVDSDNIANGTIVTEDLANNAVTSAKILDGTIATDDLADSAITSAKIAVDTIVAADIAAGAVGNSELASNAVTNAKVSATAAIAGTKISPNFGAQNLIVDTNVLFADATADRVGIGTVTPVSKLEVRDGDLTIKTGVTDAKLVIDSADNNTDSIISFRRSGLADTAQILVNHNDASAQANSMQFATGSGAPTTKMIISENGNVGIGTTTPGQKLEVAGKIKSASTEAGDAGTIVTTKDYVDSKAAGAALADGDKGDVTVSGSGANWAIDSNTVTNDEIADNTITNTEISDTAAIAGTKISPDFGAQNIQTTGNLAIGTDKLFVNSTTGRVGIGTTNPQFKLDVESTSTDIARFLSTGAYTYTRFVNTGGTPRIWALSTSDTKFQIVDETGGDARLHITSTGNVGIGTTNPGQKLEVSGKIKSASTEAGDAGTTVTTKDYVDGKAAAASVADGDKGDITVSGSGTAWSIDTDTIDDLLIDWGTGANQVNADDIPDGTTNKLLTATERTKLGGIEELADVTDSTNVAAAGAVMESDTSTALMQFVIDEDSFASDLATKVPTQQSVKAYVDNEITTVGNASTQNLSEVLTVGNDAGGTAITGLPTPSADSDAANKEYVDDRINGLTWKEPVDDAEESDGLGVHGTCDATKESWATYNKSDSIIYVCSDTNGLGNYSWMNIGTTAVIPNLSGDVTGDITSNTIANNAVTSAKIADGAVTYAKLQDLSGNNLLLGRSTAGAGSVEELSAASVRTILNVEDGADVTDSTNVDAAGATMNADTDVSANGWVLDEDDMVSDDASKVPTQQSVKAYVDSEVSTAVGAVSTDEIKDADGNTKVQVEETGNEDKIRFDTANVERMIIDNSGNVGIGTTSPTHKFEVNGSAKINNTVLSKPVFGNLNYETRTYAKIFEQDVPSNNTRGTAYMRININGHNRSQGRAVAELLISGRSFDVQAKVFGVLDEKDIIVWHNTTTDKYEVWLSTYGWTAPWEVMEITSNVVTGTIVTDPISTTTTTLPTGTQIWSLATTTNVSSHYEGKVGIGTISPNAKLHVKTETGKNAEIDIQSGAAPHWGIYQDETSQDLNFWNTANVLTLTDEGNVNVLNTLDMTSGRIVNLADPVDAQDAATRAFVESAVTAGSIADGDKGDITVSGSGATWSIDSNTVTNDEIADNTITNTEVSDTAAIAGTKIDPDFGSQDVVTTGMFDNWVTLGDANQAGPIKNWYKVYELTGTGRGLEDIEVQFGGDTNYYFGDTILRLQISRYQVEDAGKLHVSVTPVSGWPSNGLVKVDGGDIWVASNRNYGTIRARLVQTLHNPGRTLFNTTPVTTEPATGTRIDGAFGVVSYSSDDDGVYYADLVADDALITGNLGIGTATPAEILHLVGSDADIQVEEYNDNNAIASALELSKGRGTAAAPAAVQQSDELGSIQAKGYSAANGDMVAAAEIQFEVDGEPDTAGDSSDMPGRIEFHTTPDGAGTVTERMRIDSNGNVGIGTTSPSALLHVDTNSEYKVSDITEVGSITSYDDVVILLHEAYNATLLTNNLAQGYIEANRGRTGAINRKDIAYVNTGSAYDGANGSLESIVSAPTASKWSLVTVTYNGVKYLAVKVPYFNSNHDDFTFVGLHESSGPDALKAIAYYDNNGGGVLNAEINSSIADFTPTDTRTVDVQTFAVNTGGSERMRITSGGDVGIGTSSPTSGYKLDVAGKIKSSSTQAGDAGTTVATKDYVDSAAGAASVADGDKGDITVSGSGASWTIDTDTITDLLIDWGTGANQVSADDIPDGTTKKMFTATEQSKLSGIEALADVTDATNVAAAGAVMESDSTTANMSFVVDEDDMTSNSATKVPTQQSVKTYVDNLINGLSWKAPIELAETDAATKYGTCDGTKESWATFNKNDNIIYVCNGSAWVQMSSTIGIPALAGEVTGTITSNVVADSVIDSANIIDGTIVAGDLASNAVTAAKIASNAVTLAKMADASVGSAELVNDSIMNTDVNSAAAIAGTKIDPNFGSQTIFTTGNLAINSDDLFVNSSNGRVGIGTASPITALDVRGAIAVPSGLNNASTRPEVGTTDIQGEITGTNVNTAMDDGFLRLSAGGGTGATKSFIDISGYSTVPDMNRNITFGTSNTERMRIDSAGNVGIGTASPTSTLDVVGGNAYLPGPNSAPADASFANSQWSMWLDEADDYFVLKAKKSDGTVFSQTLPVPLEIDDTYVNESGDTMTGALILHANPSAALGAATKQYVDAHVDADSSITNEIQNIASVLAQGNNTGGAEIIGLPATPSGDTAAVSKAYVDGIGGQASGDFANGGDTAGADRTLGNNDNYDLGIKTNNITRLHIENDGDIGIGTTLPGAHIDINKPSPTIRFNRSGDGGVGEIVYDESTDGMEFRINGTTEASTDLFISDSGNVSIGTVNASAKLDVLGGSFLLPAQTSALGDASFENSQLSMWLDEVNDEFELKAKKSNGTLLNQTIASKAYVDAQVSSAGVSDLDYGDITVTGSGATWNIDAGVVGSTEIADNSIASGDILDGTIANGDIADNAINSAKIAVDTIVAADIAANAITNSEMADNAIGNAEMADNAIGLAEMLDNSVGSAELVNDSIMNADINSAAAIAGSKINPDFGTQDVKTTGMFDNWVNLGTTHGANPYPKRWYKVYELTGTGRVLEDIEVRFAGDTNYNTGTAILRLQISRYNAEAAGKLHVTVTPVSGWADNGLVKVDGGTVWVASNRIWGGIDARLVQSKWTTGRNLFDTNYVETTPNGVDVNGTFGIASFDSDSGLVEYGDMKTGRIDMFADDGNTGYIDYNNTDEFAFKDGNVDIDGHLAIGADGNVVPGQILDIDETLTADSNNYGINLDPDFNITASAARNLYGINSNAYANNVVENGFDVDLYGVYHAAQIATGSTINDANGGYFYINQDSTTGPVDTARGITTRLDTAASTAITTGYGYYSDLTNTGTITDYYGIYLNDVVEGTQTNAYALWANEGDMVLDGDGNGVVGGTNAGSDLVFGEGQDAAIWYDGSDLNINPRIVGTGSVVVPSGTVGIGTAAPNASLHIKTNTGTNAEIDIQSGSEDHWAIYQEESDGSLNFWNAANTVTLGSDGDVSFDGGAFSYDAATNTTSIDRLKVGRQTFEADAGVVSWVDMPISSTPAAGIKQSYAAMIDGSPVLTVYAEANGSGAAQNTAVNVTGNLNYTGNLADISDRRLKENIEPLESEDALDKLSQLQGYSFTMKDDPKQQIEFGVIAQELEKLFPELVNTMSGEQYGIEEIKTANYVGLIAPIIESVKVLKTRFEAIVTDVTNLTARVEALEAENASLKAELEAQNARIERLEALLLSEK